MKKSVLVIAGAVTLATTLSIGATQVAFAQGKPDPGEAKRICWELARDKKPPEQGKFMQQCIALHMKPHR